MGNEVVKGQRRSGGHHLGARHDQPGICFLLDMHEDVAHLFDGAVTIDVSGHSIIVHQVAPLPGIGTCGVQTQDRATQTGLLEIDTLTALLDLDGHVTTSDRLYAHATISSRPRTRNSLKNRRFLTSARMSPSMRARSIFTSPKMS